MGIHLRMEMLQKLQRSGLHYAMLVADTKAAFYSTRREDIAEAFDSTRDIYHNALVQAQKTT